MSKTGEAGIRRNVHSSTPPSVVISHQFQFNSGISIIKRGSSRRQPKEMVLSLNVRGGVKGRGRG